MKRRKARKRSELVRDASGDIIGISCRCGETILLDSDDVSRLKNYTFRCLEKPRNNTVRAQSGHLLGNGNRNRRSINVGAMIISVPNGMVPDHINHNAHDNRKSNLRVATSSQNASNRLLRSDNKSGYVGVHFYKKSGRWLATHAGKYIGYFSSAEEAAMARDLVAKNVFGEFAKLNHP